MQLRNYRNPPWRGVLSGAVLVAILTLGVQPGATVSITEGRAGRVVLESRMAAVREAQAYFCSIAPPSEVWSEELIAERRQEARREIED